MTADDRDEDTLYDDRDPFDRIDGPSRQAPEATP